MLKILTFLFFLPAIAADCPSGSVKWPSSGPADCYYFMTSELSLNESEAACAKLGGHLTSIHERFTNSFLQDEAQFRFSADTPLWIGLICSSTSICTWTDGSNVDFSDLQGQRGQGCGFMNTVNAGWYLTDCSMPNPSICKTAETAVSTSPAVTLPTTTSGDPCPYGWVPSEETNSCYYWTDASDWETAEEFCVNESAHLTSIHSLSELRFVNSFYNGYLWIGLHATESPIKWNTTWQWTDGSNYDYMNWVGQSGMPNFDNNTCVLANLQYYNANCSTIKYGMCKKPSNRILPTFSTAPSTSTNCSDGWIYYEPTNSCFKFSSISMNHTRAQEFCMFHGGHLASIHSLEEMNFVRSRVTYAWIGLYALETPIQWNTTWYWTDNSNVDFIKWSSFPSLNGLVHVLFYYDGFMNAADSYQTGVACKKASSTTPLPTTPLPSTTSTPQNCSTGWTYNVKTNACYLFQTTKGNWSTAEQYCAFQGAHLTSLHSSDEESWVFNTLASSKFTVNTAGYYYYWIGLHSYTNAMFWEWTDNSQFDYRQWISEFPKRNASTCASIRLERYRSGSYYYNTYIGMQNAWTCANSEYSVCKKPSLNGYHY